MKKIPTLFERIYENHKIIGITQNVTPGMEWVLAGEGIATVKYDGSCCAIINGKFYKRYDAKIGKRKPPVGAIPCCDPDPVTGHWPHWVEADVSNPADKWFWEACDNAKEHNDFEDLEDGTYEAVGVHFQGNPYHMSTDKLIKHGVSSIYLLDENGNRTFENIRLYLETHEIEGIVFWKDGEPQCKIKRTDFGFAWPVKKEE